MKSDRYYPPRIPLGKVLAERVKRRRAEERTMADRAKALEALIEKVEAGEEPAFEVGSLAANVWKPESAYGLCTFMLAERAYNGSLDAAKALHEAVLPGWIASLDQTVTHGWDADLQLPGKRKCVSAMSIADGPARAWLLSILRALLEQKRGE